MPDLRSLDLDRFCSYAWWFFIRNSDDSERVKFESQLWRPPPGEEAKGPWSPEAENANLSALKADLGV